MAVQEYTPRLPGNGAEAAVWKQRQCVSRAEGSTASIRRDYKAFPLKDLCHSG